MGLSDPMFLGDIRREISALWRELRNLTSGRRLEDATVGARGIQLVADENGEGGALTVLGGSIFVKNPDGIDVVYFGDVTGGSGDVSRGWIFRYDTGRVAFEMQGAVGDQFWNFRDEQGNIIVASDGASDAGLAAPYLNIPMVPSSGTSVVVGGPFWPAFTNASYQEVMHCITSLWHPKISIGVGTNAPSGTVEWELRIDGVTAGGGSGSTSATVTIPGWGDTILPGAVKSVQLWARNTAGVQSRVIVDRCYGRQS